MNITVKFSHSKKSPLLHVSPSTYFLDDKCSTGPVLMKGETSEIDFDIKDGDVLEFGTTKFTDEFEFKIWRGKVLLNCAPLKKGKK